LPVGVQFSDEHSAAATIVSHKTGNLKLVQKLLGHSKLGATTAKPNRRDAQESAAIVEGDAGDLSFAEWNSRSGQNNVIIRIDGTVAPRFPMYSASFDCGNIDNFRFDRVPWRA